MASRLLRASALLLPVLLAGLPGPVAAQASSAPAAQKPADAKPPDPTPQAAPPPDGRRYKIGPQDLLRIVVFDEPSLTGSFRVDVDGSFTYPFIGRVQAEDRSLEEVQAEIARRLEDGYVRKPQVTVEIEQFRSRNVFVTGEVRSPGKYPMSGDMTVLEVLVLAGGTNATASSELTIMRARDPSRRGQPVSPDEPNTAETIRVNLSDLQSGNLRANVVLEDGDTVVVPRAERFYVTGFVRNSGQFVWERGMTVLQALSLAGGISERGSNRRLKIIRILPNGQKKEIGVRLTDLVQPGDTLIVPQRLL